MTLQVWQLTIDSSEGRISGYPAIQFQISRTQFHLHQDPVISWKLILKGYINLWGPGPAPNPRTCIVIIPLVLAISSVVYLFSLLTPPVPQDLPDCMAQVAWQLLHHLDLLNHLSYSGSHSKLAAFSVSQHMSKSNIHRCGMCLFQNLNRLTSAGLSSLL